MKNSHTFMARRHRKGTADNGTLPTKQQAPKPLRATKQHANPPHPLRRRSVFNKLMHLIRHKKP